MNFFHKLFPCNFTLAKPLLHNLRCISSTKCITVAKLLNTKLLALSILSPLDGIHCRRLIKHVRPSKFIALNARLTVYEILLIWSLISWEGSNIKWFISYSLLFFKLLSHSQWLTVCNIIFTFISLIWPVLGVSIIWSVLCIFSASSIICSSVLSWQHSTTISQSIINILLDFNKLPFNTLKSIIFSSTIRASNSLRGFLCSLIKWISLITSGFSIDSLSNWHIDTLILLNFMNLWSVAHRWLKPFC